jgi:hypothetical protein
LFPGEANPCCLAGGFTHFLVYASSALAEQSTPAWLSINDRHASAAGWGFLVDFSIGGDIRSM